MIEEINVFLYSILIGIVFGAIYGGIIIVRECVNLKNKVIREIFELTEDLLFVIILFYVIYNYVLIINSGIMRIHIFIGIIMGVIINFILFFRIARKIILKLKNKIIDLVMKIYNYIKNILNNIKNKCSIYLKNIFINKRTCKKDEKLNKCIADDNRTK